MELIRKLVANPNPAKTSVELRADRLTLAKRRWRGTAADGREFGFDLECPLTHGAVFFETDQQLYLIVQESETLLEIPILSPVQGARTAWQIGNLHFPVAIVNDFLWVENDPAIRQLFARERIPFREIQGIFQPLAAVTGHHRH